MKSIKDAADDPSTLVDRLRGVYPIYYPNSGPTYKSPPIQHEAAREIERLRSEQASRGTDDELVNAVMLAQTDKLALEAEIERLREAIKGYEMCPPNMKVDMDENGNPILHFSFP